MKNVLEIKKLDTSSYAEILENMHYELEKKSGINFYSSDLEIVLLEIWSLLLDMQNYSMDVMSEGMQREIVKFLYGKLDKTESATGYLFAHPKHSYWLFQHHVFEDIKDIPFSCKETCFIQNNRILHIEYNQDEIVFPFIQPLVLHKGDEIILSLEYPLKKDYPFSFYFVFDENKTMDDCSYPQAQIEISYDSIHGWQSLKIKDETCQFLYSGCVHLSPHKHHCLHEQKGYQIRIRIIDAWFDAFPRLCDIKLNPIKIEQQMVYAKSYQYPMQETIYLTDDLARMGWVGSFVYDGSCYQETAFTKEVKEEYVKLTLSNYKNGVHILVVLQHHKIKNNGILTSSSGISMQEVSLEYKNINTIRLCVHQEDEWHLCPVYEEGQDIISYDFGAWMDSSKSCIRFGNGGDFMIPQKESDNVIFCDLSVSIGEKGNIKAHALSSLYYEQEFATTNGKNTQSLQTLLQNYVSSYQSSHIKCEDIISLVRQYPGNHFNKIGVVLAKDFYEDMDLLGYVILIMSELECEERFFEVMKVWLKKQLPIALPIYLENAKAYNLQIYAYVQSYSNHITQEMIMTYMKTWFSKKQFGDHIVESELTRALIEDHMIKDMIDCEIYDQGQVLERITLPMNAYAVLTQATVKIDNS